jgi:hypothetical protein
MWRQLLAIFFRILNALVCTTEGKQDRLTKDHAIFQPAQRDVGKHIGSYIHVYVYILSYIKLRENLTIIRA